MAIPIPGALVFPVPADYDYGGEDQSYEEEASHGGEYGLGGRVHGG